MQISTIEHLQELDRLSPVWESVRERDPNATVFGSWGWIRGWIAATSDPWTVLVASPGDGAAPVAFLPLGVRRNGTTFALRAESELYLAGAPMADHAGLVCAPEFEDRVLPAMAHAVGHLMKRRRAVRFDAREIADRRWNDFLRHFPRDRYLVASGNPTPCPYIPLPDSWDGYMAGSRKRKALLRRAEREGFLVRHACDETLDRNIDIFLELHQARLGRKSASYLDMLRSLVRWSHRCGTLYLATLWSGREPIAINVGFADRMRGVFHAYNGGWDEWYRKYSPRRVLELYSIRWAIEHGFRSYDLGRGGERYKFGFGAVERFNHNPTLSRRTAYASARELVRRIPELLPTSGTLASDEGTTAPRRPTGERSSSTRRPG